MNRLAIISGIIDSLKSINSITDAQVKDLIAKVVSYTVKLSELTIDPDPNNYVVYSPDEATVVGLFVKQHKGFVMLADAHYSGRLDSCWPIIRINYEAYIKMKYLIQEGKSAQREYRLLSFKNRYDIYKGYNTEDNPVADVFIYKFLEDIKAEGFAISDFENVTNWKAFGGKSLKCLVDEIAPDDKYLFQYALMSDSIHSDWGDIRQLHLASSNGNYVIKNEPEVYHERVVLSLVYSHILALESFLKWYKNDFGAEIYRGEETVSELKRVTCLIYLRFMDTYKNHPDVFVYE